MRPQDNFLCFHNCKYIFQLMEKLFLGETTSISNWQREVMKTRQVHAIFNSPTANFTSRSCFTCHSCNSLKPWLKGTYVRQCQRFGRTNQESCRTYILQILLNKTKFLPVQPLLHGTVQILLQIAELFAVQKVALFLESRVNERRNRARFFRSKVCPDWYKRG